MAKTSNPKPHAIVFPYPYQGHITPTINLALNLASKGFTITYVQLEHVHHTLSKSHHHDPNLDFFVEASESGLDMHYTIISDGFSVDFDRDLNLTEYWDSMILDFPARVDEFVGRIINSDTTTTFFLVADTLYSWPSTIARKHNLVHVSLWTEPAAVFCIQYHLDLLRENGHFPYVGTDDSDINYIPGVKAINTKDLMSHIRYPDALPIINRVVVNAFEQVKNADFILCNTIQELESEALSALKQNQPTYAIGPINFFPNLTKFIIPKSLLPESDCTHWLNSKPPGSVLYISFGSIAQINKNEIEEIAHGLLHSQVNFIWVLRDINIGLVDNIIKDRGLVVPWCDQNKVLSSSAVGGFLTHCGWNSILESMWYGVPMICYPFFADQPTNKKLVVEDWKIGINFCDGGHVTREEVVNKINVLMREEKMGVEWRQEVKKVSTRLRNALGADGSSRRNFDQFVDDLKAGLCLTREDVSRN